MAIEDRLTRDRALRACAREIALLFAILLLYVILSSLFAIGCPIKFVTGLSCPGCGLTRAWLSLFALGPAAAFALHPLFWSVPFIVILAVMYQNDVFKGRSKKVAFGIIVTFIVLYIVVWIVRLAIEPDLILIGPGSWPDESVRDVVNWRIPPWVQGIVDLAQG